jgi:hypothetical protein
MTMDNESLRKFEKEFNKSNRSIADFLKLTKLAGIDANDLEEPIETDSEYIWVIQKFGELHQCKECKAIEFVEIGQKQKNQCN